MSGAAPPRAARRLRRVLAVVLTIAASWFAPGGGGVATQDAANVPPGSPGAVSPAPDGLPGTILAAGAPGGSLRRAAGPAPLPSAQRRWLAGAGRVRTPGRLQAWDDWRRLRAIARPGPAIPTVRGIYVPPGFVGWRARFDELVALVERTELNALVIDVKRDDGLLPYASALADPATLGAVRPLVDMAGLVADLNRRGIYTIARVVTFKDPVAAARRPEWAIQFADGRPWRDRKGVTWLNPYHPGARAYVLAIAAEAARLGFREIQFDYVRFPTDGPVDLAVFPERDDRPPARVIGDFLRQARAALPPWVAVSADIFGQIPSVPGDMGIGQRWEEVAVGIDVVSPMVYPSHYRAGVYGLPNPDAAPYATVSGTLRDALRRVPPGQGAIVRPWLQDFSLGVPYGPEEVRAQIRAVYDAGLEQWLLWNPAGRYTETALEPEPGR